MHLVVSFFIRIYHDARSPERQSGINKSHFAVGEMSVRNEFQTFISVVFNSDVCSSRARKLSALKFAVDKT